MNFNQFCGALNRKIHQPIFLNTYLGVASTLHNRAFISLDLIEDCQNAIDEFIDLPHDIFPKRSTLYIYGVLQALYCQQDGAFQLYRAIINDRIGNVYNLFDIYNFDKEIREIRDDIAGHPADRKNGKKFYFISKESNTKFKFTYAGYNPEFRIVDVDLQEFIIKQRKFIEQILKDVDNEIESKIENSKQKFREIKLTEKLDSIDYEFKTIINGIFNDGKLYKTNLEISLNNLNSILNEIKTALDERYNKILPESLENIIRVLNHCISKYNIWVSNDSLYQNTDAEIFLDRLEKQFKELKEMLEEIENE